MNISSLPMFDTSKRNVKYCFMSTVISLTLCQDWGKYQILTQMFVDTEHIWIIHCLPQNLCVVPTMPLSHSFMNLYTCCVYGPFALNDNDFNFLCRQKWLPWLLMWLVTLDKKDKTIHYHCCQFKLLMTT